MMWWLPDDGWGVQGARRRSESVDRDVRLTYEVADALLADDRTRQQRVTVEVQNGVVLLSGTVHDQHTAEVVTALVRQVPGVRDVSNTIRPRVKEALEADEGALATSGQRESDAFDDIVATLSPHEGPSSPRAGSTGGSSGLERVFLAAMILLLLGWLVMMWGWPGLLIACGVSAVMVEMNSRRRRRNRNR